MAHHFTGPTGYIAAATSAGGPRPHVPVAVLVGADLWHSFNAAALAHQLLEAMMPFSARGDSSRKVTASARSPTKGGKGRAFKKLMLVDCSDR
jgi:hypothetical protein